VWRFLKIQSEFVGVRAEALAMLGTMAADLLFNRWDWEVLPDVSSGAYQGASVITRRVVEWKRSRISMLGEDLVP
jgi:hypothetical protein